ncbi:hypothetical protein [Cupriavidus sp. AcVe19-1a]|uniref:hypothetical protein n=1 Tax=Cupriavidus sp. AcVe19-1a TaxID=2821359 RepID=UPI001AE9DFC9|nr:hypothetical protein [Cupriavidus sp. AcVe19-1a]MBP0632831.1 hypothetical protein [Cupriavidus sp. AcVe19-1a]
MDESDGRDTRRTHQAGSYGSGMTGGMDTNGAAARKALPDKAMQAARIYFRERGARMHRYSIPLDSGEILQQYSK